MHSRSSLFFHGRIRGGYETRLLGALCMIAGIFAVEMAAAVFTSDFESETWFTEWGLRARPERCEIVDSDPARRFEPHDGKALRIRVDEGGHYGASLEFNFKKRTGAEPEEVFFRYYLRLGDDWRPHRGGKFPGIAGTYGRAGWGGRKVDGADGWSARGLFLGQENGKTPIGFYCYHADMKGRYGDNWVWDRDEFNGLDNNRWYCIEQQVVLNTPGKNDGVLRAWVDGELVFEKEDVRMRDVEELKIENVWVNLYYGGTWTAPSQMHVYIDDVAISKERIGKQARAPYPMFKPMPIGMPFGQKTFVSGALCSSIAMPACAPQ